MQITPPDFTKSEITKGSQSAPIQVKLLEHHTQDWLFESEYRNHSPRTIEGKRDVCNKLLWFLHHREFEECGTSEIRQFLAYIRNGHQEIGGRWGNPHKIRPVSARTIQYYYGNLDVFFKWLVSEEIIEISPMAKLSRPKSPTVQVQPFNHDHIAALLKAAHKSNNPRRDEAIIYFLIDTGVRASELCALRKCDLDMSLGRATVVGKGQKQRTVFLGRTTLKALWQYLREQKRDDKDPVFLSDRGGMAGECLTRSGLLQLIERLGITAGIKQVRCSPHTFRHTFAVDFLRNGGNSFSLQQLLGHCDMHMTARYVNVAQADIENQHRRYSPADRIKRGI